MGDSSWPVNSLAFCLGRSIAHIRGLEHLLCSDPGAYAPGFMLPPASQAKTRLFVQSGGSAENKKYRGITFCGMPPRRVSIL